MTDSTQSPIIATVDDIDRGFAARAFNGTSYSPEQRGQTRREQYAEAVNGLYAELWPLAKTEEQKALLATEMERYKQGCITRMNAYLSSHANVASSMITGPARFPTARNQKRSQWADNKANELVEWEKKGRIAIKRKLLDARPEQEKNAAEWHRLARDLQGSLNAIEGIDAGKLPYTRSAFVNSIAGKVERLAFNGEVELTDKAIELVRSYADMHDKTAISSRHRFWTFGDLARQNSAKATQTATSEPEAIATGEGVEIIANAAIDRVQIIFSSREAATPFIGKLKGEGWNWSRTNNAWQRKITNAAIESAKRITGLG